MKLRWFQLISPQLICIPLQETVIVQMTISKAFTLSPPTQTSITVHSPRTAFHSDLPIPLTSHPGGWSLALEILWFNSLYSIYSFNIPFLNLVFSQSCMLWHRITISGVSSFWSRWRHALTTSRNGTKLNDDYIESATGWYHLLDG